jgi:L-cystine transport system substrate-binding protein
MKYFTWINKIFQRKMRRGFWVLLAVGVFAGSFAGIAGCGTDNTNNSDVKKIIVGTGHAYEPYCYLDENGNLAGYEYEVLKAVNELLPQYEFTYETFDFANILLSLDSGKIDIGAHQYAKNAEREKKYLFADESYMTYKIYITVPAGNTTIHSLDDLQGKKVMTPTGSLKAYLFESYNKDHPDHPIILSYVSDNTDEEVVAGLQNGVWDATALTQRDAAKLNKAFGSGVEILKQVGAPISSSHTYFVFNKDNEQLKQDIDGALKQLKESGRLAEISRKVLGNDYTESE